MPVFGSALAGYSNFSLLKFERTCECLDLFSHDVNSTVVTGIEFQDHLPHVLGAIDTSCEGKDRRSLSGSGRSVEKEMW